MKSSVWSAECTWASLGGSAGVVPCCDLYARWRTRCCSLSALVRVKRWDLFSRALEIRSTKKVWNVSLFSLYILRRACFIDTILALIFILALTLSGWFFEDPLVHTWRDLVLSTTGLISHLLSLALPKGSQEEEDAGTEALQCCHLAFWPSWLDPLASDCIPSAVGYHFWYQLRQLDYCDLILPVLVLYLFPWTISIWSKLQCLPFSSYFAAPWLVHRRPYLNDRLLFCPIGISSQRLAMMSA